jgi:7-cyano-7-deazaguanine synthase
MSINKIELPTEGGYVVLLSGGLDSSVLAYALSRAGLTVKALTVLYGQRHAKEHLAAAAISRALGIEHVTLDLSSIRPIMSGKSALLNPDVDVPEGHYADQSMQVTVVPNRNMLLLSLGAAWSVAAALDGVAYAAHRGDHAIYPDCRPEFAEAMNAAITLCDYRPQRLLRPFVNMTKSDIASLGAVLRVPFELTWSCYVGAEVHCGKCGTCVERIEAFQHANVPDPTAYASR